MKMVLKVLAVSLAIGSPAGAANPRPVELVEAPKAPYPDALKAQGQQGEVGLQGTVQVDGSLRDVSVTSSSRSAELDRIAVESFSKWRFTPAADAAGNPIEAPVRTKIEFWKDDLMNFGGKSCADFVIDYDWHNSVYPDGSARMRLGLFLQGAGLFGGGPTARTLAPLQKDFDSIWKRTYDGCKAQPRKPFSVILRSNLR